METGLVTPVKAPALPLRVHSPLTPVTESPPIETSLKKPKIIPFQLDTRKFCRSNGTYATSFWRQWYLLMIRSFLCLCRDRSLTAMRIVIHACIGVMVGVLYFGIGNDAAMIFNNFRYIFMSIMFLMFTAFSTMSIMCEYFRFDFALAKKKIFQNAIQLALIRVINFFNKNNKPIKYDYYCLCSSLLFDSSTWASNCNAWALQPMVLDKSLLFCIDICRFAHSNHLRDNICCHHLPNDRPTTGNVPHCIILCNHLSGDIDIAGLGNDNRCRVRHRGKCLSFTAFEAESKPEFLHFQLGQIFGPFVIAPFLVFSGFFLRFADAHPSLHWLFHISYLKHALEGASLAIFGYDRPKMDCDRIYCQYRIPKKFMKLIDMHNGDMTTVAIVLIVICLMLRIIAFFIMSFRIKRR